MPDRTRPGGRVLTYRDPFADGLYAEMGAEYVDSTDEYDHRFCKELGLKVMTAKLYDAIFVRGQRFKMAAFKQDQEKLPYAGTEAGRLFGQETPYLKRLLALSCDQWQGHYFSQPLDAAGFEKLFSAESRSARRSS